MKSYAIYLITTFGPVIGGAIMVLMAFAAIYSTIHFIIPAISRCALIGLKNE